MSHRNGYSWKIEPMGEYPNSFTYARNGNGQYLISIEVMSHDKFSVHIPEVDISSLYRSTFGQEPVGSMGGVLTGLTPLEIYLLLRKYNETRRTKIPIPDYFSSAGIEKTVVISVI